MYSYSKEGYSRKQDVVIVTKSDIFFKRFLRKKGYACSILMRGVHRFILYNKNRIAFNREKEYTVRENVREESCAISNHP